MPPQTRSILDSLPSLIKETFPIPKKFAGALPSDIAELSRLLTNRRGDRALSYLARPNLLSAYLHYFLPWNLYRLCLLIPHIEVQNNLANQRFAGEGSSLCLSPHDIITDIGCGPLTFTSALWIACPDLRAVPLEFYCIDRSSPALEAGNKFFAALSKGKSPWNIHLVREDINFRQTNIRRKIIPAALVCAVNIFNEIYETLPHNDIEGLQRMAANAARLLCGFSSDEGFLLIVEPGVPQSGNFISLLRASLLELGHPPASPCTHSFPCPLTKKSPHRYSAKWCHFAFETIDAPKELQRLSASAKLPKERLVFSFLLAGIKRASSAAKKGSDAQQNCATQRDFITKTESDAQQSLAVRVISDAFPLPGGSYGRYGCCTQGLVLLIGEKSRVEKMASLSLARPFFAANRQRDEKSGALIVYLTAAHRS